MFRIPYKKLPRLKTKKYSTVNRVYLFSLFSLLFILIYIYVYLYMSISIILIRYVSNYNYSFALIMQRFQ